MIALVGTEIGVDAEDMINHSSFGAQDFVAHCAFVRGSGPGFLFLDSIWFIRLSISLARTWSIFGIHFVGCEYCCCRFWCGGVRGYGTLSRRREARFYVFLVYSVSFGVILLRTLKEVSIEAVPQV